MQITIREPGSALTHFIAMMMAIFAAIPLLIKASASTNDHAFVAMCIFIGTMILLYAASTTYHSVDVSGERLYFFKRLDHMMIFVMVAGSYTPVCLMVLDKQLGTTLLTAVWIVAIVGMLIKALWINCPKWFSSVIYIAMGWMCVCVFGPLVSSLTKAAFLWLLGGGIFYTVGGVIYSLKLSVFHEKFKYFGTHELFHVFIMFGSVCHFVFMYLYVI
ncbi:MAG: hemolysin III family protein [Lachnospiraceae bacterium]|nr:hemolysin III family protein [Lachnospiraceae bacterium]